MKRIVPYPLMGICLVILWLLLNQSVSLGHVLLGSVISVLSMQGLAALRPEPVHVRFSPAMIKLAGIVLFDIFRSNLAVGRIIASPRQRKVSSGFINLPLDMTNRYGLAILSTIITATPGTLWMQYDPGRHNLVIHVLDLVDEGYWINLIKTRYEALLMDIFE